MKTLSSGQNVGAFTTYLFPNHAGPRVFGIDPSQDEVEEDLTQVDWKSEVVWFEKKYSKELALIKKVMGDDMEIRWGLITYAN